MITDQQYVYFAITLYENIVKTVPTPVSSKTVQGREKGMDSEVLNKD